MSTCERESARRDQEQLPFTVQGRTVRFFAGSAADGARHQQRPGAGALLVSAGDRVHKLGASPIRVPWIARRDSNEQSRGICGSTSLFSERIGLLVEWLLYGRARTACGRYRRRHVRTPAEMRQAS